MKKEIIRTAADLFLNLGFKSVTMDDIANSLGISKKTIYAHFTTKTKLVEATTFYLLEIIDRGIEEIRQKDLNAIKELLEIKKFVMFHLKDEKSSPQFQLNKYYPKIYQNVQKHHMDTVFNSIVENLKKGIDEGLYRPSLPLPFVSRIYFFGMTAVKSNDIFPEAEYSRKELTEQYLEYHLRAIVTPAGLQTLEQLLEIKN